MIKISKNGKLIHLYNEEISYYIFINDFGFVQNPYFGDRIDSLFDIEQLVGTKYCDSYFDKEKNEQVFLNDGYGFRSNLGPFEVISNGLGDSRVAPIVFKKSDGSFENKFLFVSLKVYKGIKPLEQMPSADRKLPIDGINNIENVDTLEIKYKDFETDVYLIEYISIYNDKNIIIKNFEIINKSNDVIRLDRCFSMNLDLLDFDGLQIHHFKGKPCHERFEEINDLVSDSQIIESVNGKSSHYENPFVYLTNKYTTLDNGYALGFNLIWSGNFKFSISKDFSLDNTVHIVYGINDKDFEFYLKRNDRFVSPQAVICYSNKGINKMSQTFHDFVSDNVISYMHKKEYRPLLLNSWEGTYFDFNTNKLIEYIKRSKDFGIDLFVLDDGWFGKRNDDKSSLGDWFVNTKKVDLKKVINYAHSLNLKFGIWFEPEMVSFDSELYREHPEYVLGKKNNKLSTSRNQLCLDFTNPHVIDNIFNQIVKIIDEYKIDYVKWDYNREVAEHYSNYLNSKEQGEVYYRLVIGYYSLFDRLVKRYPDILFEGCAGGGGRFDLGSLYYAPQIWASDETDPTKRIYINYYTSIGYPLSTIGTHVSASKFVSYKVKANLSLFGTCGYELNPIELNEDDLKILKENTKFYKDNYLDLINDGTLYHLLDFKDGNFISLMSVSKNKEKAMTLIMNKERFNSLYFLKFKGLNKEFLYINSFDNKIYSGDYLEKIGLKIGFDNFDIPFSSLLIIFNKVKEEC